MLGCKRCGTPCPQCTPSLKRQRLQSLACPHLAVAACSNSAADLFSRLDPSSRTCLRRLGICDVKSLGAASLDTLCSGMLASPTLKRSFWDIVMARCMCNGGPSVDASSTQCNLLDRTSALLASGSSSRPRDVLDAFRARLPFDANHPDGATPATIRKALVAARTAGCDIKAVLDAVSFGRTHASILDSSSATYASHFRGVCEFCDILGDTVLPASVATIRRVACCINCPSTLRGYLAAWRFAHIMNGLEWHGDSDPFLSLLRRGCARLATPRAPRKRMQAKLMKTLISFAFERGLFEWCAITSLCWCFLLRMNSEFFKVYRPGLLRKQGQGFVYGPIWRKGHRSPSTINRGCLCASFPLACPHAHMTTLDAWCLQSPRHPSVASVSAWTNTLHSLLPLAGIHTSAGWSSHACRRGGALDLLQLEGLSRMLSVGGWHHLQSALSYVSRDELDSWLFGCLAAANSDDEAM